MDRRSKSCRNFDPYVSFASRNQRDVFQTMLHPVISGIHPFFHEAPVSASVVVGRSAPDVEFRSFHNQGNAVFFPCAEESVEFAELEETSVGFDLNELSIFIGVDRPDRHFPGDRFSLNREFELSPCDLMPRIRPEGGTAEEKGNVEEVFRTRFRRCRKGERNFDGFRRLRLCFQGRKHSGLDRPAILRDVPGDRKMFQREKIIIVCDFDFAFAQISGLHSDGSDDFFVFDQAGGRGLVGEDETVGNEIAVMRRFPEIAAVGVEGNAVLRIGFDAVVAPFPDESALHVFIVVEGLPVRFESAGTVAHRVSVLAHEGRIFSLEFPDMFFPCLRIRIHAADDIDSFEFLIRFVVNDAGGSPFPIREDGRDFLCRNRIHEFHNRLRRGRRDHIRRRWSRSADRWCSGRCGSH